VVTPERFAEGWATVRQHAVAAGRDPEVLTPGVQVWCNLSDSDEEARAALAPSIEAMYRTPYERFARYTICGTPETWLARIGEFAGAGVRHFNLIFAGGDVRVQMARFATEVMPLVSEPF
jgi:alkanesulfonate monooxygenase SsuD/methylene tetrahydromethanopterin reductase-like flavin-dependent oxidoreductase (luciferase family)